MSANSMTPKQAAVALVAAIPTGVSVQQLEEYGIEATTEQAQAITQEVLSLNLFWIFAAIEAHLSSEVSTRPLEAHLGRDGSRMGYNRSHRFSCLDRLPQ
jgi:hypothetical protein